MGVIDRVRALRSPYPAGLRHADARSVRATPAFAHGSVPLFGAPVRFSDNAGFLHSVREVFADDIYRFEAGTDTPHIIDAGANIGLSVIYFKRLYPKSTIVAYEPDAAIFEMLRENVGRLPGVELRREAAWIEDTTLSFYSEGSLAGSTAMDYLGTGTVTSVPATRLRDELRKRHVDFLKIDIEGAENSVLFDIVDELAGVDHLFFEYHSVPGEMQRLGDMLNLVTEAGFRYVINGAHGPRLPFVDSVDHGFDLQLNVFCIRKR